jgi:hypothetical protein
MSHLSSACPSFRIYNTIAGASSQTDIEILHFKPPMRKQQSLLSRDARDKSVDLTSHSQLSNDSGDFAVS